MRLEIGRDALEALVLPPASLFVFALAGLVLRRWWPRTGRLLLVTAGVVLYLLSTPLVSRVLLVALESDPPVSSDGGAGAIVVLAADAGPMPEYGGETVGDSTLERLRYAAWLKRRTGLPLLASGGPDEPSRQPIAELMRQALEDELGVSVRWTETGSRDTRENAIGTARILEAEGVRRVLLVTHAWHMPRARASFEAAGLEVVPAPTGYAERLEPRARIVIPSAYALRDSARVFHERIGLAWYRLRYFEDGYWREQ